MTTLLIVTVGRTDVQFVIDGQRQEMSGRHCAHLHDQIEERKDWQLVDSPPGKREGQADGLPSGALNLCTPKLDAVLSYLAHHENSPTVALVLDTRRDAGSKPDDPRFAGALLAQRLRNRGVGTVVRRTYLEGRERFDDPASPRDAVVRREVVQRLEQAVCDVIDAAKASRIVVATTGGFPGVGHLIEEIVRLHATSNVEILEVADGSRADPPIGDRAVPRASIPEPLVSFQARRRALELIAAGNLLGAWAVAEPLDADTMEHEWTQVIDWLARFAASLPMPGACDIAVLTHQYMAVRTAIRVEFALRAKDIPRAVHGTVAFFESALWDHLGTRVTRHADRKRLFALHQAPDEDLIRKGEPYESKTAGERDRKRPFVPKETVAGTDWYWIDDSDVCAIRIADSYLRLAGLTKFGQAVSGEIRELRNDVAHNEPTAALMEDAHRRMVDAGLWSKSDTFLSQSLVQGVLREMGQVRPESLCQDLVDAVRSRLVGFRNSP